MASDTMMMILGQLNSFPYGVRPAEANTGSRESGGPSNGPTVASAQPNLPVNELATIIL
jgi:hypothetical protein